MVEELEDAEESHESGMEPCDSAIRVVSRHLRLGRCRRGFILRWWRSERKSRHKAVPTTSAMSAV